MSVSISVMNIIVKTASGRYIVRPDTTWERDSEDLFVPEFVNGLSWTPVLFARISKPGRSVGERFGERYYDGIGYGVLLYPEEMLDGSEEGFACALCLDHTSFLPFPVIEKQPGFEGRFKLEAMKGDDARELFTVDGAAPETIRKAISEATRFIYIRIGDLIAIELQPRQHLCSREDSSLCMKGMFDGTTTLDFCIHY